MNSEEMKQWWKEGFEHAKSIYLNAPKYDQL